MEPFTSMWADLKQANKLPKQGSLWSSCEAELSELMKQIDIMVHQKRMEWERANNTLKAKLDMRDQELVLQKATLDQKHKEIGQLKQHLHTRECKQRETVTEYEGQLTRLRNEVANIKREYEKLQRKHNKHVREMEREKSKNSITAQDSASDISKLNQKLEEYKHKANNWELEKRTYQKQIDSLESQRKTLAEKCEFIQQQATGYHSELDKRRNILESSELNLKSQITQLESQLERARDTINSQETQVERLKASLDDSISSHRKALDEKEHIVDELRSARSQARKLEEDMLQFKLQLQSRDDRLRITEQDRQKLTQEINKLQHTLLEKEKTIESLEEVGQREESDQVNYLKGELRNTRLELKSSRKAQKKLEEVNLELGLKIEQIQRENFQLKEESVTKSNERHEVESLKLKHLSDELMKTKDRLSLSEQSRIAEVENLRKELMNLNFELQKKEKAYEELDQRATSSEEKMQEKDEYVDKISAEREVINAQLEAVRLENQHLRQTLFRQTQKRADIAEGEGHLRDLHNIYSLSISKLETENLHLKRDLEELQQKIENQEGSHMTSLSNSDRIKDDPSEQRWNAMQNRLDQTVSDYEQQLKQLNEEKQQLQQQLEAEKQSVRRLGRENLAMSDFMQGVDIIVTTPAKRNDSKSAGGDSAQGTMQPNFRPFSPGGDSDVLFDNESIGAVISEQFLAEEEEKTKELERILDWHIEELSKTTFKSVSGR